MHFAHASDLAPPEHPALSGRQDGPFREMDMLAIGTVLLAVLVILAVRKVFGKRD